MEKLITDTIVDIICEKDNASHKEQSPSFKKGFFLEKPYLLSKTTLKSQKLLVNKEWVEKEMEKGARIIKIPANAIITPMAKMFLDEKRINVQRD